MAKYEMNLVAIGTLNSPVDEAGKITKSQSASIYEDKNGHQHVVVRYMEVKDEEGILDDSLTIEKMVDGLEIPHLGLTREEDDDLVAVPVKAYRVTYIKSRCIYTPVKDEAGKITDKWTVYGAARYSVEKPAEKEGDEGHEVSPLTVAEPVVVKATRKKAVVEETPVVETPAEETPAE